MHMRASVGIATWLMSVALVNAWGFQGHQLTAAIAEELLSPAALVAVRQLLPTDNLTTVSTWADQIKRNPNYRWTSNLHYVNPKDDEPTKCQFNYQSDCPGGRCVVGAIYNFTARVADRTLDVVQRAEALKFLVHYIGDIHQPLHVSGREKGGNGAIAKFGNAKTNLHSIWDSALVKKRMGDFNGNFATYFTYLLGRTQTEFLDMVGTWTKCHARPRWSRFTVQSASASQLQGEQSLSHNEQAVSSPACPDQWAVGINALNCKYVWPNYSSDADLSADYYAANFDVVEQSLIMGGVRLASVLNFIFEQGNLAV